MAPTVPVPLSEAEAQACVRAQAAALRIPMDEARVARVAGYLALSAQFAAELDAVDLDPALEPAEVFCPAPFPAAQGPSNRRGHS